MSLCPHRCGCLVGTQSQNMFCSLERGRDWCLFQFLHFNSLNVRLKEKLRLQILKKRNNCQKFPFQGNLLSSPTLNISVSGKQLCLPYPSSNRCSFKEVDEEQQQRKKEELVSKGNYTKKIISIILRISRNFPG